MPRRRRYIKSGKLYEITFRAWDSLPFCCTEYMQLLIDSIFARVQRDNKVIVHHRIFEGSHPHIICTALDAGQCTRFYGELQKRLTEAIKRLLGLDQLNIWDGRASVIELSTFDDAVEKIAYLYANPSNDNLESCIEKYPGASSWEAFCQADSVDAEIVTSHPWIRGPMIPELPSAAVSKKLDKFVCEKMLSAAKERLWIKHFIESPTAKDAAAIKKAILEKLRAKEADNAKRRDAEGNSVIGASRY